MAEAILRSRQALLQRLLRFGSDAFAASKSKMVVAVTALAHHAVAVPVGSSPPAVVGVRPNHVEDEPAPFHLGVTVLAAWIR